MNERGSHRWVRLRTEAAVTWLPSLSVDGADVAPRLTCYCVFLICNSIDSKLTSADSEGTTTQEAN